MLALVTCESARDLDADMPLLSARMPDARVEAWDDPSVDWARYGAVVVRSAWNYHERRDEFLAWCRRVESVSALWNPLDVIEWNTDKRYLDELARLGVPVVPSTFVGPGRSVDDDLLVGDVVVKPTVGAGSNGVLRSRGDRAQARRHLNALHDAGQTAVVQPYIAAVDERGETGLVYVGGAFSHAFGKSAILAGPVRWEGGLFAVEQIEPREPTMEERRVGDAVMGHLPPTAYARIDVLPGESSPLVVEVELTEPSLFLDCDPAAAARAAAAFRSLVP